MIAGIAALILAGLLFVSITIVLAVVEALGLLVFAIISKRKEDNGSEV